jgi:hypothetical protein
MPTEGMISLRHTEPVNTVVMMRHIRINSEWKYRKIHIAAIFTLLFILTCVAPLSAHPASAMDLQYNTLTHQLNVTITHPVANPGTHYIRQVVIKQGAETRTFSYSSQPSRESMTYQYALPPDTPGPVEVTASCSIGGDISRTLFITVTATVPPGETPPALPPDPATLYPILWPFHAFFMITGVVLFSAAILMVTYLRQRRGWYRLHRILAGTGTILAVAGLSIALYMVRITGGPNLRVFHGMFGALVLTLVIITLLLGLVRDRVKQHKVTLRTVHLWSGRGVFVLLVVTIILGLRQSGLLP